MNGEIELVTAEPSHDAAERLLNIPASDTTPSAESIEPSAPVETPPADSKPTKRKRGRPAGSKTRKKFTRDTAKALNAGSSAADAPAAATSDADAVTGPVQDGPLPTFEVPDPALLEFAKPYGPRVVMAITRLVARFTKKEKHVTTEDEALTIGEALVVVVILRAPSVAMRAPEAALVAALMGYVARITTPDHDAPTG